MTALRNGLAMGLTVAQMVDVVRSLTRADFYKSMTSHADHRIWQDVYHSATPAGKAAYIKVSSQGEDKPPVIQFKEL